MIFSILYLPKYFFLKKVTKKIQAMKRNTIFGLSNKQIKTNNYEETNKHNRN